MKASRKIKRGLADPAAPTPQVQRVPQPEPLETPAWVFYVLGFFATFLCAFYIYSPALEGPFVFDDLNMPFMDPNARGWALPVWFGIRPLLMTTFWANLHLSNGSSTFAYHAVNVVFHASAAILLFFALRRILDWAKTGNSTLFAALGAAIFLLHPIQTEAVSYIAQRGEDLGAVLYFAAFCVFLYRKPGPVSWPTAIAVAVLYGAAVITKEHTVTLPALLLLTDYFFNPGYSFEGAKRNWRLYSLVALGFFLGLGLAFYYLKGDISSVGFQLKEFSPAQYLYTEWRVFFEYVLLFFYPLLQTIDYDFPISHNILEHGSILYLVAILGLVYTAIRYRRKFPLASYGFLVFCILLLPTSSIIPIRDPIADRRLYLPMIGLLFIVLEFFGRWKAGRLALLAAGASLCVLLGAVTYQRNEKWSNPALLWADAVDKNPDKSRIQFGLATALFLARNCHDSIPHYEKAIQLTGQPDYQLYMNLGLAQQCDQHPADALASLKKSIDSKPTAEAWAAMGIVQAQQGNLEGSLEALDHAEKLKPAYIMTYIYRGGILSAANRNEEARRQFQHALDLEPDNAAAKSALSQLSH